MFERHFNTPVTIRHTDESGTTAERPAQALLLSRNDLAGDWNTTPEQIVLLIRASFEIRVGDHVITPTGEYDIGEVRHCLRFDGQVAAYRCTTV